MLSVVIVEYDRSCLNSNISETYESFMTNNGGRQPQYIRTTGICITCDITNYVTQKSAQQ